MLTHAEAVAGWAGGRRDRHLSSRARMRGGAQLAARRPPMRRMCTGTAVRSSIAGASLSVPGVQHACGPGKTYEHLRRAGVQNLRMFPQAAHWRQWLGL